MNIWKWCGLDTKEARIIKAKDWNKHSTIQLIAWVIGLCVFAYIVWG
jgi:hypothetical protein